MLAKLRSTEHPGWGRRVSVKLGAFTPPSSPARPRRGRPPGCSRPVPYLSVPRCKEAGCNSSTDGSFRSLQFLHFHLQPPDKLSGRCLHRRYFSLMRRWAEDWRRSRGWGGGARGRVPIKLRLNETEVEMKLGRSNAPAQAAREQVGKEKEVPGV